MYEQYSVLMLWKLRNLVVVEDVLGGVDGLLVHGDHQHGAHIAGGQWRSFSV